MSAIFLEGNSLDVLKGLPSDFVHCCVTSPPYFGLRRYQGGQEIWDGDENCRHEWGADQPVRHPGQVEQTKWKAADGAGNGQTKSTGNFCFLCGAWKGQLGGEPTPGLYISHLVQIFREVRRVLRPDGVAWCNIGDSWAGSPTGSVGKSSTLGGGKATQEDAVARPSNKVLDGVKPLDMVLIPSMLALALRADGWYLRSIVCWSKLNPMPESVRGWTFTAHRVKIKEYAKMRSLWESKHRGQDWPFDLPRVSEGETEGSETQVSVGGQVSRDGTDIRATTGGQREAQKTIAFRVGEAKQSQVRSYQKGQGNTAKSYQEVLSKPERESQSENERQEAGVRPTQNPIAEGISQAVLSDREGQGGNGDEECSSICLGNGYPEPFDGVSMVADSQGQSLPLPLLQPERQDDIRPCDTSEQRGKAHKGQCGSGLPKLQQQETRQDSSDSIDCPGCPKCAPNDGLVLRKGSWRPTDSYEQILMLTKTDSYYCDKNAVLEPIAQSTIGRGKVDFGGKKGRDYNPDEADPNFRNGSEQWGRTYDYTESNGIGGRNMRSVWTFPTKPGKFNHYAAYPPRLVEICVKSSTSEKGCCPKCGSPYARVIARKNMVITKTEGYAEASGSRTATAGTMISPAKSKTIAWRPTCDCNAGDSVPCVVLDPFSGAGTTALVCEQLSLDSFSIDTSSEYIQLAKDRLADDEQKRCDEFIKNAQKKPSKKNFNPTS